MTTTEFVLEIAHRVHYTNRDPVPIAEIAASLLALERILLRAPKAFSLMTNVPIEGAAVFVDDIQTGSLIEDVVVKLFFRDQAGLDAFLKKINEQMGQKKVTRNVLLGAIILSILGYGLYSAAKAMASSEAAKVINVNNNVIINIGAHESGLPPEQLEKIISAVISDKKANARDAIDFVRPAKRDPEATISMEDKAALTIPREVIAKSPSNLVLEVEPNEKFTPDVDLHVRATNLDSSSSGWAGLVPMVVDRRVKLVLADGVDPKKVAGKFTVRADVILHSKPQGAKQEMSIYQITLVRLIE